MQPSPYQSIIEPLKIGNLLFKNRIFISSHTYGFFDSGGLPTEQMLYYVVERAKGGAALLIMGETLVSNRNGQEIEGYGSCLSCDDLIPLYQRIAKAVKPYNMRLFDQMV